MMEHILCDSPNALISKDVVSKYTDLQVPCGKVLVTYVWIDENGEQMRSKDRTIDFVPKAPKDLPMWVCDAGTKDCVGAQGDVLLFPQVLYPDPFRRGFNLLALCDTYRYDYEPTETNHRKLCAEVSEQSAHEDPWFGLEQEYYMLGSDGRPFGWPKGGFPRPPGSYYCGVGAENAWARDLVECHVRCCLFAGVGLAGTNAEVAPGQWEFQVGPVGGVKAADDVWMARYLMYRLAEEYGLGVTFDPKPVKLWSGTGAHMNFSTKSSRDEDGIVVLEKYIDLMSKRHQKHIESYDPRGGKDNERRLVGSLETSHMDEFSAGIANRNCSIRIPRSVAEDKKGYLEDRRPAGNCDPYSVCRMLMSTCILGDTS